VEHSRTRTRLARVRAAARVHQPLRPSTQSSAPELPKGPTRASKHAGTFNVQAFLHSAGLDRTIVEYQRGDVIFTQGDPCESVLYLQKGGVKISVLSKPGKEVVVATLGAGDLFGEGGLAGQPVRMGTATAITRSTILFVDQNKMVHLLHQEHAMSDWFIARMLVRNIRIEEDLVDQLFNSAEKRLARKLLLLARYHQQGTPTGVIPTISQEALAEMVGTTRSRVNFFLKKFQRLGFIDCTDGLKVHKSLLTVFIHESGDR
jgi:CRP/FNR family transcriptional regulator, cyclic AMP receptor protein